jgi:hypothetical protein
MSFKRKNVSLEADFRGLGREMMKNPRGFEKS